jgi:hypothetical protein
MAVLIEWGNWVKTNRLMRVDEDGVVENIQQNNPSITDVLIVIAEEFDGLVDWAAAGASIGSSNHMTNLNLMISEILNPLDMEAFFESLALNKCIKCLQILFNFHDELTLHSILTGKCLLNSSQRKKIQHLSLNMGPLSKDACTPIKRLLSDRQCVLKSLVVKVQRESCISSFGQILNGLVNNQYVNVSTYLIWRRSSSHTFT